MAPADGMEDIHDSFHQNEDDQSPTEQAEIPPQVIESDLPD